MLSPSGLKAITPVTTIANGLADIANPYNEPCVTPRYFPRKGCMCIASANHSRHG